MNIILDLLDQNFKGSHPGHEKFAEADMVLKKGDLGLIKTFHALARMRRLKANTLYVLVRDLDNQHNMFLVQLLVHLSGAQRKVALDESGRSLDFRLSAFLAKEIPLYLVSVCYFIFVCLLFFVLSAFLCLYPRRNRYVKLDGHKNKSLCYLKTDFWFSLEAGGSVTHTAEFINAGIALGYRIDVFSADPLQSYKLNTPVQVIRPSRLLQPLSVKISQIEYNIRFALKVYRIAKRIKPMALYQRSSMYNFSGVLLSGMLHVPLILESNNSLKWEAKNWGKKSSLAIIQGVCERINYKYSFKIAVVSDEVKQSLIASGVAAERIIVNPNGVDSAKFNDSVDCSDIMALLPPAKCYIGFIGIFGQWHGVLTLASCVKFVVQDYRDAHFLIIGDGALKAQMVDILEEDGVLDHVSFLGVINHADAPRYLNACRILLSPHEDMKDGSPFFGSPTKIFEYMAMGKGIVASKVGQLREILDDGVNALLVGQKNSRELASAILQLINDPALCKKLGAQARSKVISCYSWEQNFSRAMSTIENL